jgi:anthranilate phosphoribosyltransferase
MNAAMLLYAAGKGDSLAACYPLAKAAVERGEAARKLAELTRESDAAAKS